MILLACFGLNVTLKAQNEQDSLLALWQDKSQTDSLRVYAFREYIFNSAIFRDPDEAIALAEALRDYAQENNYPVAEALYFNIRGLARSTKGEYAEALRDLKKAHGMADTLGDKLIALAALINTGNIHRELAQHDLALSYFRRALKEAESTDYQNVKSLGLSSIGYIYAMREQYESAAEYIKRALEIEYTLDPGPGLGILQNNLANIYMHQGKDSAALELLLEAQELFGEFPDHDGRAAVIGTIGEIYLKRGELEKARTYFERSRQIFGRTGNVGEATITRLIGEAHLKEGHYQAAEESCKQALAIVEKRGVLDEEKNACLCLYEVYKAMGEKDRALEFLEKANRLKDTLNSQVVNDKLKEMEVERALLKDSVAQAEKERLIEEAHQAEMEREKRTRYWLIGSSLALLILTGGAVSRYRYIRRSKRIIEKERDRSDDLLLNILPAEVAAELKEKGYADAREYDQVSILFTDFEDFTAGATKMSAAQLVKEINVCFEAFDRICEKHEIEKIKTIGDAYMAAGGLPVPEKTAAKKTVLAALEMQDFVSKRSAERKSQKESAFEMRLGIHTGPVVAGIVGVKKFQYDIWGDTVNTASRLEAHGATGKVNISASTYQLLKNDPNFRFEARGKVAVKGKGALEMYFVERRI